MNENSNVIPLRPKTGSSRKKQPTRVRLSETKARSLPAPQRGFKLIYDSEIPQLALRITANGARAWVVNAWDSATRNAKRITLGKVGDLPLKGAREQAAKMVMARAKTGSLEGGLMDGDLSLKGGFDQYLLAKAGNRRLCDYESWWRNWISPRGLDNRRIGSITTEEFEAKVTAPAFKKSARQHNKIRSLLHAVYDFHLRRRRVDHNPISAIGLKSTEVRTRTIRSDELTPLLKSIEDEGEPYTDLFKVLLGTGMRVGAVCGMRWQDLDLTERWWMVPAASSKNKKPIPVRLATAVLQILEQRHEHKMGAFVFPSPTSAMKPITYPKKAWARILDRAGIPGGREGLTPHDLRRSMGMLAAREGLNPAQIAAVLGHMSIESARAYTHLAGDIGGLNEKLTDQLLEKR